MRRLVLKAMQDKLTGGKADDMVIEDIARKHGVPVQYIANQLEKGTQIEMEHTNDPSLAREIAKDHLMEIPDYYTRLQRMEDQFEAEQDNKSDEDHPKTIIVYRKHCPVERLSVLSLLPVFKIAGALDEPRQWQEPIMDLPPIPLAKSRMVIFKYTPGNPGTLSITTPEIKSIDSTPLIQVPVTNVNEIPMLISKLRDEVYDKVREYAQKMSTNKEGTWTTFSKVSKIVKRPDGWHVIGEKGKHLGGPYASKSKARKRLRQVEMFKHLKGMRRNTLRFLRVAFDINKWTYVNPEELKKLEQKLRTNVSISVKDLIPVIGENAAITLNMTTDLTPKQIAEQLVFAGRNALQIRNELAWRGYGEKPQAAHVYRRVKREKQDANIQE